MDHFTFFLSITVVHMSIEKSGQEEFDFAHAGIT
jgi:hypothetical protein